ncbi:Pogo transposase / Cenp-B / PDC2, DNA-binding HTH domain [Penicillium camemberti]|uniref:Pogo transposase / Cenp-B / PDC2, DNA-binding HTH domain n=1 Tax=Penicillium camemberti (strain FM 013) TaxID=1429867 RepID=A0A0G4PKE9_PENC3|nr:Pogo transposase / Cenp-B / PDC2, DNA-binding HTH domain [Penicillium camemberti]
MVREMANLLLEKRGTTPILSVGENWVTKFVKRHPLLSSRFSKRYNYDRAKCEDPKIIREWFDLVQKTILQFRIDPDDIYNFDETGFAMGLTATAKIIIRSEYYGRRPHLCRGGHFWPQRGPKVASSAQFFRTRTFGPRATRSSPAPCNAHRHVLVRSWRCLGAWLPLPCPRAPLLLSIDFYPPPGLLLERYHDTFVL